MSGRAVSGRGARGARVRGGNGAGAEVGTGAGEGGGHERRKAAFACSDAAPPRAPPFKPNPRGGVRDRRPHMHGTVYAALVSTMVGCAAA